MNSLVQSSRSITPNALNRSALRAATAPSGRSLASRRLQSTDSHLLSSSKTSPSSSSSSYLSSSRPTVLRSSFLPHEIRPLLPSSTQSRSFHLTSTRWQQPQEKPSASAEAKSKASGTESKDETAASGEKQEQQQQQKKEGESEAEGEKGEGKEEQKQEEGNKKKEDLPPPPPHGDKTPWQVFMDTMQTELKKSKEWNESTKALSGEVHAFNESERMKKARAAYTTTTGVISDTTSTVVKTTAGAIGKGAAWTWDTGAMKGVRKAANVTGDALDKATKPIRDTEAYKNVKDVIDDGSSSRYGGWVDKEERRKKREAEALRNPAAQQNFEEDPDAGTNVTLHKDAAWKEAWRDFRDQNKFVQGVFSAGRVYQESENPLISTARSITDTIGNFFAENEQAQVIKRFRTMDPNFQIEPFLKELREYILPEVLDAYVKGDIKTLKLWLSEAQYSVYEALTKQYLKNGMKSDGRILDIRHVDIVRARMLDPGEIPVFVITCRTQEVHVYRKAKTNELAAGMEDKVQLVTYAIGITRVPEDVSNPETRGWRLIEMQKSARDYY